MLTHVVLMTFTDRSDAVEAKTRLEALVGRVPQIRGMHVGLDVLATAVSADLCMTTVHLDADDLRGYQTHPDHLELAGWLKPRLSHRVVVDYLAD